MPMADNKLDVVNGSLNEHETSKDISVEVVAIDYNTTSFTTNTSICNNESILLNNGALPCKMRLKIMEKLGNGAFGIVYKAIIVGCDDQNVPFKFPNNLCAIKKIRKLPKYDNEREIRLHHKLNHENIVRCLYYYSSKSSMKPDVQFINLVMEYMPTDLFCYIKWTKTTNETIPELTIVAIIFQILYALSYIHDLGICHRDIKPHNILFNTKNLEVKICDFGNAKNLKTLQSIHENSTYVGSRIYRAPELLFNKKNYSYPIDIWACGCILGELMLLEPLFSGNNSVEVMESILNLMGTPPLSYLNDICNEYDFSSFPMIEPSIDHLIFNYKIFVKGLLKRLLILSPNIRPTANDILKYREFMDFFVNGAINNRHSAIATTFLQLTVVSRDFCRQNDNVGGIR